jgi:hypothetical protein
MEDLIFVTGCTLVTSWAAAAFTKNTENARITLATGPLFNGMAHFSWSDVWGSVEYHSYFNPVRSPGYVYSACTDFFFVVYKAKFTRASGSMRLHQRLPSKARPLPDPNNPSCGRTPS